MEGVTRGVGTSWVTQGCPGSGSLQGGPEPEVKIRTRLDPSAGEISYGCRDHLLPLPVPPVTCQGAEVVLPGAAGLLSQFSGSSSQARLQTRPLEL